MHAMHTRTPKRSGGGSVRLRRRAPGAAAGGLGRRHALHVLREQTFFALDLFVVDGFAVLERSEAIAFDAAEVYEHIFAFGIENEPEALFRIEPLDVTRRHGGSHKIVARCSPYVTPRRTPARVKCFRRTRAFRLLPVRVATRAGEEDDAISKTGDHSNQIFDYLRRRFRPLRCCVKRLTRRIISVPEFLTLWPLPPRD